MILGIVDADCGISELVDRYGSTAKFQEWLDKNQAFWQDKLSGLGFKTGDDRFDSWLKWVAVQPVLRRLYGNSFLPYHDYGRGGRGWRDLWQDSLVLLMMDSTGVDELLWNYFAGVRMDGSNATIIGTSPGEFKADRNDIPRVWMDHGAWPWLTTKLYIDQSADLDFLFRPQVYFKDRHIDRCQAHDKHWHEELGTQLRDQNDQLYQGTILEHLLVQHLTAFFNVGEHNNIRLEGGDWNDGMDMAAKRGESVAFTALFASNLHQISEMVKTWTGSDVEIAAELALLLDTLHDRVNYESIAAKQERLKAYLTGIHQISGERIKISTDDLAKDLESKASWLYQHLRSNEWIQQSKGVGWFNGYYDNDGERVEGFDGESIRMTLTGQVFTMMGGIADDEQIHQMVQAADQYLREESMAGYRLNTDFGKVLTNLGRFSGFAYGHKENGAVFSHMAMMWANALYQRGLVNEGWKVISSLYQHCQDFAKSGIFPGIPEYIDPAGKGRYPYLTGSASWLLLTLLGEVFGVKGHLGDLILEPKLVPELLDKAGEIHVLTSFADRKIKITYSNPGRLEYGKYAVSQVRVNGDVAPFNINGRAVKIPRDFLLQLHAEDCNAILVSLGEADSP
jgi:cellobiose phosphorylase